MARRRARARPQLGRDVHRGDARLRGRGRRARRRSRDRPGRLSRPLSDPRDLHVPHQPLARRDARGGRGQPPRVRTRVARARDPRVGGRLVGAAGHGRRPARADPRRAARLDRHAPERDGRRGGRPLLLQSVRRAEPDRLRGGELPVGALPVPGAAGPRGRRGRGRCRDRGRDRRADAARPDQPCPVQERRDPGRRADRPPRARGWRPRGARLLPVGGRRAAST